MASKKMEQMVVRDYEAFIAGANASGGDKVSDDSSEALAQVVFANNTKQPLRFYEGFSFSSHFIQDIPNEIKIGESVQWVQKSTSGQPALGGVTFTSGGGQWLVAWKVLSNSNAGSNKVYVEHTTTGIDSSTILSRLEQSVNISEAKNAIGVVGSGSQAAAGFHAFLAFEET